MPEPSKSRKMLRPAGFVLLLAGWLIVISAVSMVPKDPAREAFVLAGLLVEMLGLAIAGRSFISPKPERR